MALERYRAKRDFAKTPEPAGRAAAGKKGRRFVIQKHAARRLHYDFRLELDGVLVSWAVPKGPSLDPAEKRLAVHVEDHPLDYADFEGVIPAGQYGGGTVLLWDRGTWEPEGDPKKGLRRGKLVFRLDGEKLHGAWSLVRMGGRDEGKENWLLVKRKDDAARPLSEGDILEERPESVKTGRTMEEIAANKDRVWHSNRPAKQAEERIAPAVDPSAIEGARRRAMPPWVEPELATRVRAAPEGDDWLHEIKLDGYRILARIEKRRVRLLTRKGLDWTDRFAPIAEALAGLPAERALVDGEVVVVEADGTTRFQALQEAISEGGGDRLSFYGFDLLHLDGWDLTRAALEARKGALASLLARLPEGPIQYSDHVVGNGPEFFDNACSHAVEGIVSKLRDRPYRSGRGRDWVKVKCVHRQEFVIGGWTEPSGSRQGLGALLLGVRDRARGPLRYAGKVGTGFTAQTLADLSRRLKPLARPSAPFADPVPRADARGAHWVEPRLVAEIEFAEWTRDGRLRHPSFQGLREDLPAQEVTREVAVSAPEAEAGPAGRDEVLGVRLSNPDRVLWPEQGITKRELARYIEAVADRMLPHVAGRPLTLIRCPRGREKQCFYQKHADDAFPPSIRRVMVKEERGKSAPYLAIDDAAGLVTLVQFGVLEFHPWGSRADDLERPDHLIFDLDPDEAVPWKQVVDAARVLRGRLEGLGLPTFVKTTGGKGLHVEVPLVPEHGWEPAKTFAQALATAMARDEPARYVATASKAGRRGKIYVDWLRNARGATAVAPYSPRARSGAPVATPLRWEELGRVEHSGAYRIGNLRRRLASLSADPWEEYDEARASLTPAIEALVEASPHKRRRPRAGSRSGT